MGLMIKIGQVKLPTNILLAPLSGYSDLPFRLIAREHGAKFCFYEMVDAHSIIYARRQALGMLRTHEKDSPIAGQLLGSDPTIMLDAAQKLLSLTDISFLDINCACPVKKVIKKKAGAHLLRDTPKLYALLKKLVNTLPIPVTIKMRIGYNAKDLEDITTIARQCEDLGISAIFVHGRIATQGYAGDIDYNFIKSIKDSVKIPVFGSGNILSCESAKKMFYETGCDGILVARGSFGNPWIFSQIEDYFKTGRNPKNISTRERKKVLLKHLSYINEYKHISDHGKLGYMRKIAILYLKGIDKASYMRAQIISSKSPAALVSTIKQKYL